jgi:MFS family permease
VIRNIKAITASSFICMFFLGVGATIIGAAARNIGLSPYQIGLLIAIQNIGFMISVIITGTLSDTYEKPKLLLFGNLILAIAYFTFYIKSSFLLNLLIMFFIGIGIGSYEGVTDAMLLDIHSEKESFFININHFFVTFGSLMITVYLVFLQMNWRRSVVQSAAVVLMLALFYAFTRLEVKKQGVEKLGKRLEFLRRQKIVWILFFATICTVGLEMGSVGILTTFLMEYRDFTQVTSKLALILFLSGVGSGRIIVGFLTKKDQILNNIMILFGLATIFISCMYFLNTGNWTYVVIYFTGMTLSSLLPLIITLAGLTYKEMSGTVMGIIKIGLAVGGILIPFLISMITRISSFKASLFLFPAIALASFLSLYLNRRLFKAQDL